MERGQDDRSRKDKALNVALACNSMFSVCIGLNIRAMILTAMAHDFLGGEERHAVSGRMKTF